MKLNIIKKQFDQYQVHVTPFIKDCLLFRSSDIQNRISGLLTWCCIAMFLYATFRLLTSDVIVVVSKNEHLNVTLRQQGY
jgi:hypothetical protein